MGLGVAIAAFYSARLAFYDLDTTWNRKGNPEPWNDFSEKQFKVKKSVCDLSFILSMVFFAVLFSNHGLLQNQEPRTQILDAKIP